MPRATPDAKAIRRAILRANSMTPKSWRALRRFCFRFYCDALLKRIEAGVRGGQQPDDQWLMDRIAKVCRGSKNNA